jgi:hypothetical protein
MAIESDLQDVVQQLAVLAARPLSEETLARMWQRMEALTCALALAGEVVRRELPPEAAHCETEPPTLAEIVEAIHQQRRVWRAMDEQQPLASLDLARRN